MPCCASAWSSSRSRDASRAIRRRDRSRPHRPIPTAAHAATQRRLARKGRREQISRDAPFYEIPNPKSQVPSPKSQHNCFTNHEGTENTEPKQVFSPDLRVSVVCDRDWDLGFGVWDLLMRRNGCCPIGGTEQVTTCVGHSPDGCGV